MTRRTNANFDILAGGTCVINGPASAGNRRFGIIGMQAGFHEKWKLTLAFAIAFMQEEIDKKTTPDFSRVV